MVSIIEIFDEESTSEDSGRDSVEIERSFPSSADANVSNNDVGAMSLIMSVWNWFNMVARNLPNELFNVEKHDQEENSEQAKGLYECRDIVVSEEAMSYLSQFASPRTLTELMMFMQLINSFGTDDVGVICGKIKKQFGDHSLCEPGNFYRNLESDDSIGLINSEQSRLRDLIGFQQQIQNSHGHRQYCSWLLLQSSEMFSKSVPDQILTRLFEETFFPTPNVNQCCMAMVTDSSSYFNDLFRDGVPELDFPTWMTSATWMGPYFTGEDDDTDEFWSHEKSMPYPKRNAH